MSYLINNGKRLSYNNKSVTYINSIVPPVVSNIKYGYLYNWYAASNPLFAPAGWHVPTNIDIQLLGDTLGTWVENDSWWLEAGGKMKEIGLDYWNAPNTGANNISQFNSRGGGFRYGPFTPLKGVASYQGELVSEGTIVIFYIYYDGAELSLGSSDLTGGKSVRFVKNDSVLIDSVVDIDGNIYRTTKIGDRVWLADNWACTKLNDGTPIPNVTDNAEWVALTTGAYCANNNDINNAFII